MFPGQKVIISDYHNMKLWDLEFSWNRYILNYHHVTDQRYFQILRKSIQKERFKWPVKNLRRPEKDEVRKQHCKLNWYDRWCFCRKFEITWVYRNSFYCLRNVERQTKDIYTLAHSTQDHQIKGEKQLIDLTESTNFRSDKFKGMRKTEQRKIR